MIRIMLLGKVLITAQNITSPFSGNVYHCTDPGISGIGRWSDINLSTFFVYRHSRKRHVVLPANKPSNLSDFRIKSSECCTVSLSPNNSFCGSWLHFPMLSKQPALRVKVKKSAVKRFIYGITFRYPNHNVQPVLFGNFANLIGNRTRNPHAVFPVFSELLSASLCSAANNLTKTQTSRISGNKTFRKNKQINSLT